MSVDVQPSWTTILERIESRLATIEMLLSAPKNPDPPPKRETVTYEEVARSYIDRKQSRVRDRRALLRLIEHFRDRRLVDVVSDGGQSQLDEAVASICAEDAKPGTILRAVIIPHTAVLNHGARRGWCASPNFERPRNTFRKTNWLKPEDAARLIEAASPHLKPLLIFLLGTGARVSEALLTPWEDVDLRAGTVVFRGDRTKNGRSRIASMSPRAIAALEGLPHREGRVFRRPDGEPYVVAKDRGGSPFKNAWAVACRRAGLPGAEKPAVVDYRWLVGAAAKSKRATIVRFVPGISPHGLRHTWATYFQAATRDPMRLREEGGWSSVSLVERYAHQMKQEDIPSIALVWGCASPDQFRNRSR